MTFRKERFHDIEYTVRVSPRAKRVLLRVTPHRGVEVVVPRRFDRKLLPKIIESKRAWLDKAILKVAAKGELAAPSEFELRAAGEQWRVEYEATGGDGFTARVLSYPEEGRHGVVQVEGDIDDVHGVSAVLKKWLSLRAKVVLAPWMQRVSAETGVSIEKIAVRGQSTRWASCARNGNISLNRNLLFLPDYLVRHVFLHELCHRTEMNHSPRFWALLIALEPRAKELESEVRAADQYVPRWALPE